MWVSNPTFYTNNEGQAGQPVVQGGKPLGFGGGPTLTANTTTVTPVALPQCLGTCTVIHGQGRYPMSLRNDKSMPFTTFVALNPNGFDSDLRAGQRWKSSTLHHLAHGLEKRLYPSTASAVTPWP